MVSILAVLMLRGPQTPGELKQRSERLHRFADLAATLEALERLVERELVARHPRRPGQKEDRYEQLLGGAADPEAEVESSAPPASEAAPEAPSAEPAGEDRLDRIEREIAALRAELAGLREALGEGEAPSA